MLCQVKYEILVKIPQNDIKIAVISVHPLNDVAKSALFNHVLFCERNCVMPMCVNVNLTINC